MHWLAISGIFFGVGSLLYAYRSKTIDEHPSQRGLFVGTGVALLGTSVWVIAQEVNPLFGSDDLFVAFLILLSVPMYWLVGSYPLRRKLAGEVLHGVRRPRSRFYSGIATAALFLILLGFTFAGQDTTKEKTVELIFYAGVVMYFVSPLFGKVDLREHGIMESYTLIRWGDISSYSWSGENAGTLVLSVKSPWRKSATLLLPPDEKEAVDKILKERVTGKSKNA